MRIRAVVIGLVLSAGAAAQDEAAPAGRGDLGMRYWLSTGETRISHNAQGANPAFGNPTSILTYENLDAHTLEVFGRQRIARDWFLKGFVGLGKITTGSFDDEDYFVGQVKFSDTTSSVSNGWLSYGALDVGHQWVLAQGRVNLGAFGGFSQWTEQYEASGLTSTVGTSGSIDRGVKVITNKVRWRALRVGFAGQFTFGRARLGVDVAAVPYAKFYNEDSHHLRGDLGPVPNIIDSGEGSGVQAEVDFRYEIARRTEVGIGLRYWHLEADSGTSDFVNLAGGQTPIVEFYTWRSGVTLSVRRTW